MDVPLCRPYFNGDELAEVAKVLSSGWVSKGPESELFERAVAQHVRSAHAVAVVNCTAALHLALLSIGIKKGDEVLVADFTFPATGHSVLYCGAKPIFVDVRPDTYNMNVDLLPSLVTKRTKAIIPVHTFGQPADMDEISKFAEENDLYVIEDAACALGATYDGKQAGSIGDLGCYSFHARKGITTGEGGMVVTSDGELADRVRHLSTFGMRAAWEREKGSAFSTPVFTDVGFNYKLSDILAAVGLVQMGKIEKIIERKKHLAKLWDESLGPIAEIVTPQVSPRVSHVYQSYVCVLDGSINRNEMIVRLRKAGIQAQIGTYASHLQPVYRTKQKCPASRLLAEQALALPLFYEMSDEQVGEMAKIIMAVVREIK